MSRLICVVSVSYPSLIFIERDLHVSSDGRILLHMKRGYILFSSRFHFMAVKKMKKIIEKFFGSTNMF